MLRSPYFPNVPVCTLIFFGACCAAVGQTQAPTQAPATPAAPPPATGFAMSTLRPALANVQTAVANLSIPRWKTTPAIRTAAQQDVASIQRDLTDTLPGLVTQADAPAANGQTPLSPAFAVFRNLDALYDVLLRVSETASFAGSAADAANLEDARAQLEDGRAKLGAWLLQSIGAQDAQVVRLLTPPPPPAAAPAPAKVIVDDGPTPAPPAPKPRRKKPATPPATPPPAPQ
jgi:hypothetical protein